MNLDFEDQRHLEAAQGYLVLGLYIESNQELEAMSRDCRSRQDVLLVRLGIYRGIRNSDLMEIVALQLARTGFRARQICASNRAFERPATRTADREALETFVKSQPRD